MVFSYSDGGGISFLRYKKDDADFCFVFIISYGITRLGFPNQSKGQVEVSSLNEIWG